MEGEFQGSRDERILTAEGVCLDVECAVGVGDDVVLDSPRRMARDGDWIPFGFVDDVDLVRLTQKDLESTTIQSVLCCCVIRLLLRRRGAVDPRIVVF